MNSKPKLRLTVNRVLQFQLSATMSKIASRLCHDSADKPQNGGLQFPKYYGKLYFGEIIYHVTDGLWGMGANKQKLV